MHLRVVHFTLGAHDLGDNWSVVVYQSVYFHASSLIDEGVVHVIIQTRNRQKKIVKKRGQKSLRLLKYVEGKKGVTFKLLYSNISSVVEF